MANESLIASIFGAKIFSAFKQAFHFYFVFFCALESLTHSCAKIFHGEDWSSGESRELWSPQFI